MSNVNYSLNHKGVRLVDFRIAWVKGKNGKLKLNPNLKPPLFNDTMIITLKNKNVNMKCPYFCPFVCPY